MLNAEAVEESRARIAEIDRSLAAYANPDDPCRQELLTERGELEYFIHGTPAAAPPEEVDAEVGVNLGAIEDASGATPARRSTKIKKITMETKVDTEPKPRRQPISAGDLLPPRQEPLGQEPLGQEPLGQEPLAAPTVAEKLPATSLSAVGESIPEPDMGENSGVIKLDHRNHPVFDNWTVHELTDTLRYLESQTEDEGRAENSILAIKEELVSRGMLGDDDEPLPFAEPTPAAVPADNIVSDAPAPSEIPAPGTGLSVETAPDGRSRIMINLKGAILAMPGCPIREWRYNGGWTKTVEGLDKSKDDGFSIVGTFLSKVDSQAWHTPGLYLDCNIAGSRKRQSKWYTLFELTPDGLAELVTSQGDVRDWAVKLWPDIANWREEHGLPVSRVEASAEVAAAAAPAAPPVPTAAEPVPASPASPTASAPSPAPGSRVIQLEGPPPPALTELWIETIDPSPFQARMEFDAAELVDLANSIQSQGLLQPIVVRPKGERYELVAGERRLRAMKMNGSIMIPAIIREADDAAAMEFGMVENLLRSDIKPLEMAAGFQRMLEMGYSQAQIGEKIGRSQGTVANTLRLLQLPWSVQTLINQGKLGLAHGIGLLRFSSWPELCERMGELAVENEASSKLLAKGLPFADILQRENRTETLYPWDVKWDLEICKNCPFGAYMDRPGGPAVCLRPAHFAELKTEFERGEAERIQAQIESARTRAAVSAGMGDPSAAARLKQVGIDVPTGDDGSGTGEQPEWAAEVAADDAERAAACVAEERITNPLAGLPAIRDLPAGGYVLVDRKCPDDCTAACPCRLKVVGYGGDYAQDVCIDPKRYESLQKKATRGKKRAIKEKFAGYLTALHTAQERAADEQPIYGLTESRWLAPLAWEALRHVPIDILRQVSQSVPQDVAEKLANRSYDRDRPDMWSALALLTPVDLVNLVTDCMVRHELAQQLEYGTEKADLTEFLLAPRLGSPAGQIDPGPGSPETSRDVSGEAPLLDETQDYGVFSSAIPDVNRAWAVLEPWKRDVIRQRIMAENPTIMMDVQNTEGDETTRAAALASMFGLFYAEAERLAVAEVIQDAGFTPVEPVEPVEVVEDPLDDPNNIL